MNKRSDILHVLTALIIILMYFYVLDLFQPRYIVLCRGVAWIGVYDIGLVNMNLFSVLLLIMASIILIACHTTDGFNGISLIKLSVFSILTIIVIDLLLLLYWIVYMCNPADYTLTAYVLLPYLDAGLFHVCSPVYPILLLATLYSWLSIFTIKIFKIRVRLKIRYCRPLSALTAVSQLSSTYVERLGFTAIILLGIILTLIPYLPTINPGFKSVSVDIKYYSEWLNSILSLDGWSAIKYVFYKNWNRSVYVLMLYSMVKAGLPSQYVLNLEGLFIAPFFALTVYYMAKRIHGASQYATLASLSGLLGFNMTANMFGGFFMAWTALSLFYLCVGLTPSLMREDVKALALCVAISILMLYIHPWTWSVCMATLLTHLAISALKYVKLGKFAVNRSLFTLLVVNAIVDFLKNILTPCGGGVVASAVTLTRAISFENILKLSWSLNRLTYTYLMGLLFNPLHMALALVGVLSLLKLRSEHSQLTLIWLAVASTPFIIVDTALQSRLILTMPFPILIAEGLWALSKFLGKFDSKLPKLFQAFFIVSSLTYTVRALCNLI
ncbi:MAG: hypothetical protein QXU47_05935 [Candidatus Bathyarchaeia archaeon]